ncbi:MAG: carboxypeptidase regulatory-like domain-containing protein [Crocinitomicaceae bacterium]|nr:carboxypeptidase regulatory-like domain-containing protein [Crocinitomicaceae bacterium]
MKNIFLILIFFSCKFSMAYEYPSMPAYEIVSDTLDSSIKKGVCIIEGYVREGSGTILPVATVSNVDGTRKTKTNATGHYYLKLTSEDTSVFVYHVKYGEIVIPDYDFKSQHRVVINFYFEKKAEGNQNVKKPVIYLYNETAMRVSVSLDHPGMTFTYPKKEKSWELLITNGNELTDVVTGKKYPYLFWEAKTSGLEYEKKDGIIYGYMASSEEVVNTLEHVLTAAGLNERESTDFITFWAPQLIESSYVFMQFVTQDIYAEKIAPINVSPEPESQLRLFMYYTPLNSPEEFGNWQQQEEFTPLVRTGFTLIEWGGAAIETIVQ